MGHGAFEKATIERLRETLLKVSCRQSILSDINGFSIRCATLVYYCEMWTDGRALIWLGLRLLSFHRMGKRRLLPRYLNYEGRTYSALTLFQISRDPTPCIGQGCPGHGEHGGGAVLLADG